MDNATATYSAWKQMIRSAYHPADRVYCKVGAKGIRVCPAWREQFVNFHRDMGDRPPGAQLRRRDVAQDFTPKNCFWSHG